MNRFSSYWRQFVAILISGAVLMSFQNCASEVEFSTGSDSSLFRDLDNDDVICNPLDPTASCDVGSKTGLVGNLYYLVQDQAALFNGNLNNAKLADYITYGEKVNKVVLMSQIEVPERNWQLGFSQADGSLVKDKNGNDLLEWFSLDLYGYISLLEGNYQFATVSDDGMLVEISDSKIIEDDGVHAPRWKCATSLVSFAAAEKKKLHVQYFQGPRQRIAMQLLVRPASEQSRPCDASGGWMSIPPDAYSR